MQDFLNVLKKQGTESEKMNVINLMEEKALNQLLNNKELSNIFTEIHNKGITVGQEQDDVFERDFNKVLQKMTKTGKKNTYYAGQKAANTLTDRVIVKEVIDIVKDTFDETVLEEMKNVSKRNNIFNVPEARSQKTDISVNGEINLSIKPEYQKIMNLFSGRKFSLKNYSSNNSEYGIRISLGSTDPLKAFIGVLTSFNETQDVATKVYYASLASYVRNQNSNNDVIKSLNSSIFSLRYYYELTGAGLKIDNVDIGTVDFLIVNNPNGRVAVKSTKDLIYTLLSNENKMYRESYNPYREIHAYIKFDN